jgi:hypothetical protein
LKNKDKKDQQGKAASNERNLHMTHQHFASPYQDTKIEFKHQQRKP